ncbi:MAG: AAA domain-containing protein, partial [Vulcanimicrobiaceae bacterium]
MRDVQQQSGRERTIELARERIVRLYKFVAALYDRRNPVVRQMNDHEWTLKFSDIPDHPSITLTQIAEVTDSEADVAEADDSADVFLRCKRPPVTPAPPKPDALRDWLGREWDDCRTDDPQPLESRNVGQQEGGNVLFTDDPSRVDLLHDNSVAWQRWAANERTALSAGAIFEKLYALHGKLQREAERYELVLADGLLVWYRPDGGVRHPLLLRPMRLEFDAEAEMPEFRIVDAGATTEFYSSLFRSMADVDGRAIGRLRTECEQIEPHPLGIGDTDGFLRSIAMALSAQGQYSRDSVPAVERPEPVIGRAPSFLLRKRTSGVAHAIDAVAEDAMSAAEFAQALCNIVGRPVLEALDDAVDQTSITASGPLSPVDANEDINVLFTKPANTEQLEIARRLDLHDCVLVQGPPGTGKTHTIANLLGHLLAKGKSVLVCSHTTKALKVLREKVVSELQPLCVSVMDAPEDDQALKSSVEGIVERLSSTDDGRLSRDIARFEAERATLIAEAQNVRTSILNARLEEQHPLIVGGGSTGVIDAAKEVAAGMNLHDWIPGPVTQGEPLPLTYNELADLYATTGQVSVQDEQSLLHALPEPSALPTPERFHALTSERVELTEIDDSYRRDLWEPSDTQSVEELDAALTACQDALTLIVDRPEWTHRIINDGAATDLEQRAWLALLHEVDSTYALCMEAKDALVLHGPQISAELPEDRASEIYSAIAGHVHEKGGAPSFLTLLARREWKVALDGATLMGGRKPRLPEHFDALAAAAKVRAQREVLRRRWQAQVASSGGPQWDDSDEVEATCKRYSDLIRTSLEWHASVWKNVQRSLYDVGLRWDLLAT